MTVSTKSKYKSISSTEFIKKSGIDIPEQPITLTENALTVLKARYLKRDDSGAVTEEPRDMFLRVSQVISDAEDLFGTDDITERMQTLFYNMMASGEFMPNSPTLMNAGRDLGQLSACFVLPIEDSMDSIFQSVKDAAIIHKSGGGTGFSFSRLRPKNDVVRTTRGISSGPVSFMSVFDSATETIKQGGTRRGANMAILRVDHPDIREFITCKSDLTRYNNFNISVAITDEFMRAVESGEKYDLINPNTRQATSKENARDIFNLIVDSAHASGEPGLIFIDRINEKNQLIALGEIESTNPCGEQPLLPYESCNLGSINLSRMLMDVDGETTVDWSHLGETVHLAVRFLDNVIEVNKFPLESIAAETKRHRKIGLGIMGFADMLIKLGIPYDSEESEKIAGEVMSFINRESKKESRHLAELRGPFPSFSESEYARRGEKPLRNATTTTIAPTGTISIISSCTSGIEPVFALSYNRNVLDGEQLTEFHPLFLEAATNAGITGDTLKAMVSETSSISQLTDIPEDIRRVFRTANDIPVEWHIRIQSAFQNHTDNAVSKTVNFPHSGTHQDVTDAYMQAFKAGLKGITIYRDGSRDNQVLSVGKPAALPEKIIDSPHIKPRPRPSKTSGTTEKLLTGCGKLYVTVNSDESGMCEVFCQMGRSGGCTASQSEAISRLISLALRCGIAVDDIVAQLKGIRCPSPTWQNGKLILSCSDAIATAISHKSESPSKNATATPEVPVYTQSGDLFKLAESKEAGQKIKGEMAGVCPDCSGVLEYAEGCAICRMCGFSRCG